MDRVVVGAVLKLRDYIAVDDLFYDLLRPPYQVDCRAFSVVWGVDVRGPYNRSWLQD